MKGQDVLWKESVVEVEVTNGMGPMDNKYGMIERRKRFGFEIKKGLLVPHKKGHGSRDAL